MNQNGHHTTPYRATANFNSKIHARQLIDAKLVAGTWKEET
jgi:hypothetical protein